MNTKLGLVKVGALAICCAFGFGMTQLAHADSFSVGYHSGGHRGGHGHGRYSVSVGLGSPSYYGGYYAPRPRHHYYAPSAYYYQPAPYYNDSYSYDPYYSNDYYNDDYYAPSYSFGYSSGYGGDYDRDDYYRGGYDRDDRGWDRDGRRDRDDDGD